MNGRIQFQCLGTLGRLYAKNDMWNSSSVATRWIFRFFHCQYSVTPPHHHDFSFLDFSRKDLRRHHAGQKGILELPFPTEWARPMASAIFPVPGGPTNKRARPAIISC
jgi:hypothetical protein